MSLDKAKVWLDMATENIKPLSPREKRLEMKTDWERVLALAVIALVECLLDKKAKNKGD